MLQNIVHMILYLNTSSVTYCQVVQNVIVTNATAQLHAHANNIACCISAAPERGLPEENSIRVLLSQRQAGAPRIVAQRHHILLYFIGLPTAYDCIRQRHARSLCSINDLLRKLEHLNWLRCSLSCRQKASCQLTCIGNLCAIYVACDIKHDVSHTAV